MQADFLDAQERHWDDAERLYQAQRWANADHLYGFAAECGLKKLMLAFGMVYDADKDRPQQQQDRVHANGVWPRYEAYRSGNVGADYSLPQNNAFDDWHVSDRYARQVEFDQMRAQSHRAGAQTVLDLIKRAQLDGWIT